MRFDGYGATIRTEKPRLVLDCLANALNTKPSAGPAVRRFGVTTGFNVGPRLAVWMGIDPNPNTEIVYIEAKGETTPEVVEAIRRDFPLHSAPRLDVCEDYDQPGAFEALQAVIRATKGPRVSGGYVALPDDIERGRTWAAGTRGGVGYIRVYEAGKHPDRVHLGRPNWSRAELEARPHYAKDKAAAATMSPLDVWGVCRWTHQVGERLTSCPINRFEPEIRQYSHDKTTLYIARTFRRHLQEMHANGEDFARTFEDIWADDDKAFKASRPSSR